MKRIAFLSTLILLSCGGIESSQFEVLKLSRTRRAKLLKVLSDPKESLHWLGGKTYAVEVNFSAPVDPESVNGNVFLYPVIGDAENGENVLGEGIPITNFRYSPERTTFFFLFSVEEGEYVLLLKKEIKDLAGNQLDGRCDERDEPQDAVSSGFSTGTDTEYITLAFCQPSPTVSYITSLGNDLSYGDGVGCEGEANTEFTKEPVFVFTLSFPTGTTKNYIRAGDLGREVEIYDLTVGVRRPIYFSLNNGVSWREDINEFDVVNIPDSYYIYVKPVRLDSLHRYALRINRYGGLRDRYGIPFWDGSPDDDDVYEVCFTTRGEVNTLRVGGVETIKDSGWVTGIKVWFDTPSNENENMDYDTLIPENFYIYDVDEEKVVGFNLEVHRETVTGRERDTVLLRLTKGTLPDTHTRRLVISHKVMDYLGNTLDGNSDGYIDGDSRDDYILEWK